MSSCAASCSIYSHAASSASATSASLPTGNVPDCCHSASVCFVVQLASSCSTIACNRPSITLLELSCVRRNDARPRTTLSSSTPAPFSALRRIRRMNPQLHPRSLLVSAHAYRPCVSRLSKKLADHLAAGSRLLKTVLPAVPCRQGRPTQCLKPRAENTRIGSDPSKAHRIGSH